MIKITLFEQERDRLKYARKKRDANVSERCFYVLLSDEGKSVPEIAKHTKRNGHTIRFWLMAYQKDGLEGLKGTPPPGRPPVKTPKIYPLILEIVPKSPTEYGYIEDGWTIPMIVDYLKRQGIDVSPSTVKRVLKKTVGSIKDLPKQSQSMPPVKEKRGAE